MAITELILETDGRKIPINYGLGDYCNMVFKETKQYDLFFNMLPLDWQEVLLHSSAVYEDSTVCYVVIDADEIVAGGLVLSKCPTDMLYDKEEADAWFEKGYLYLEFI